MEKKIYQHQELYLLPLDNIWFRRFVVLAKFGTYCIYDTAVLLLLSFFLWLHIANIHLFSLLNRACIGSNEYSNTAELTALENSSLEASIHAPASGSVSSHSPADPSFTTRAPLIEDKLTLNEARLYH
ncbi:unnamed protein product [Rhizophagus irregularis]|nr:unnamed protein product [Rhizophagus irregularis]CAB5375920.1 unnamed protein product [Rhizophagus irregularis]